jgi:hypothetical protein
MRDFASRMLRQESLLLALPEPCLLAVLQYCAADDQRSLFSAARAHSKLRQAAAAALRSITADVPQLQQAHSVKLYLRNHAQHVSIINLKASEAYPVCVRQFPPELQLKSLQLEWFHLQLLPGTPLQVCNPLLPEPSFQGVLGDAARVAALTQLRLTDCDILDGISSGALAALSVLPTGLEHLSISRIWYSGTFKAHFPAGVLPRLQQLTYLELAGMLFLDPPQAKSLGLPPVFFPGEDSDGEQGEGEGEGAEEGATAALQPLQALTHLDELHLDDLQFDRGFEDNSPCRITASIMPSSTHVKCLVLSGGVQLEPDALAGKTQLQLLDLDLTHLVTGAAAEVAQLLSHIQQLQDLTHLRLRNFWAVDEGSPPATAYSVLTASSKLQHLSIDMARLPDGVLRHLFPAGRHLPNLQFLKFAHVRESDGELATMPEGSRLVSCCPSLQTLVLGGGQGLTAARLAPLQGLSGLHMLHIAGAGLRSDGWQAVCQLTRLRDLHLCWLHATQVESLQATQLHHLTRFVYRGHVEEFVLTAEVGWGRLSSPSLACATA